MNKKIWRKDRELMVLVNSAGAALLLAADGERVFSKLVEEAFVAKGKELTRISLSDVSQFNQASEFEDRFLQSAVFTLALWSRGFINFLFAEHATKTTTSSQLLKKIGNAKKPLTVYHVLDELAIQYKEDFLKVLAAFHQEQANVLALLLQDTFLPIFMGETEQFDKTDVLPDTIFPQYNIGYVKPSLAEKLESVHENVVKRNPYVVVMGAATIVTGSASILGDSCGQSGYF